MREISPVRPDASMRARARIVRAGASTASWPDASRALTGHTIAVEHHLDHARELVDGRARRPRVIEQQVIELGSRDLPGLWRRHFVRHREVREAFRATVGRDEGGAPLAGEAGLADAILEADGGEDVVDRGQQRFADVEAREPVAFEQHDRVPRAGERGSRRGARGTPSDHDHITVEPHGPGRLARRW